MRPLRTVLSPRGYRKILAIMGSDEALSKLGQNFASGSAVYTIAVRNAESHRAVDNRDPLADAPVGLALT